MEGTAGAGTGGGRAAGTAPTVLEALPAHRRRAVLGTDAGCALLIVALVTAGRHTAGPAEVAGTLALAALSMLATRAVVPWITNSDHDGSANGQILDLSGLVFMVAALLLPVALVPLVCLPGFALDRIVGRRPLFAVVLNALALTAVATAAAAVRVGVDGGPTTGLRWAAAAWGAAAVYVGGVLAWAVAGRWLVRGIAPQWGRLRETVPLFQEVAMAATAVLGATMWRLGPPLVIYLVGPVAILQRLLYFREVQLAARTDGKTGLLNYRHFDECARRRIARAHRSGAPLALLVVDMDRLRDVNNAFGHQGGDQALGHVAAVLAEGSRPDDLVCRFGGEEFLVLMPHTPPDVARAAAERLRETVRATPLRLRDRDVRVSVSIGVAALGEGADDLDALVALADVRVYAAKDAGRDRVVSSSSPTR